jgi:DNA polymerase-3 subunit gamma/tau
MLGTAGEEQLATLLDHLVARNSAGALSELDAAMNAGVDAGQLIEQLFGVLRDCMVASVGCARENFLYTSPSGAEHIAAAGKRLGLNTLLAVMQILDQTLGRMQYSTQGRILAELALVRICQLEDLDELSEVIAQIRAGVPIEVSVRASNVPAIAAPATPSASAVKKNVERPVTPSSAVPKLPQDPAPPAKSAAVLQLNAANALAIWSAALDRLSGIVVEQARQFDSVAFLVPNRLVIRFKPGYAIFKTTCERPEQVSRFEQALAEAAGQPVRVEFALTADEPGEPAATTPRVVSPQQRRMEAMQDPLVQRAAELFDAQIIDIVDPPPKE